MRDHWNVSEEREMTTSAIISNGPDVVFHMGEYTLKFEKTEFDSMSEAKARKELRESPELIEKSVAEFRKLIKEEANLTLNNDSDEFLIMFLRPCKYYPESAMEKMKKFYKFKVKQPKFYENLLPSIDRQAFDQSLLTVLPARNAKGERAIIIEVGRKWVTKECSLMQLTRCALLTLEAAIKEPMTQVSGAQVVLDMEGLSMQHVWQFTPIYAKDLAHFVQDCIPIRLKAVHIVNQPYVFNMLFQIFKPFLNAKLRNRIHFHGTNFTNLHEFLEREVLPTKYGGNAVIPMNEGVKFHEYLKVFEEEYERMKLSGYLNGK